MTIDFFHPNFCLFVLQKSPLKSFLIVYHPFFAHLVSDLLPELIIRAEIIIDYERL